MSIIETIRAEIERLKKEAEQTASELGYHNDTHNRAEYTANDVRNACIEGYQEALSSILDTLQEKSEKPINPTIDTLQEQPVCDGLEEEIDKRWKEWLSEDKEQAEGILPKSEFSFYARHFYELGKQSKKRELLPMIERICVSCPEKVKAESALNKFISKNCVHCSIEHCPGVKACYTSSNEQLQ